MKPDAAPIDPSSPRREFAFVAFVTLVGLVVRAWGLGRLGLVHFDEGIYALAGLRTLGPGGIDPLVVPYAPPGFPGLVGLAYLLLGPSDVAAILVSIAAGTLAIPAAAWLARRTFGPGAGATAAALAALSGFHVAFSRMALTDAAFVLAWLAGLIVAQRFLERPGPVRAVGLGLATGLAQLVKYSGWTLGVATILATALIVSRDPARRGRDSQGRAWGWGAFAALVAAIVYAPWYRFVEGHGGYAGLIAHHRGYVGSAGEWLPHWTQQIDQVGVLSGGFPWNLAAALLAAAGVVIARGTARPSRWGIVALAALGVAAIAAPTTPWWAGLAMAVATFRGGSPAGRLLGVVWLGLSILTPFYHPYARLWLPIQAIGWVALAGLAAEALAGGAGMPKSRAAWVVAVAGAAVAQALATAALSGPSAGRPGVLAPSDSLRRATALALADLPESAPGLRVLARPSVTFYLAGRGGARVEPDARSLLEGGGGAWALVDLAQLRQSGEVAELGPRLLERWEKVGEYPTTLNLPTLLDVDPGAASHAEAGAADAPLWLLRPRRPGGPA